MWYLIGTEFQCFIRTISVSYLVTSVHAVLIRTGWTAQSHYMGMMHNCFCPEGKILPLPLVRLGAWKTCVWGLAAEYSTQNISKAEVMPGGRQKPFEGFTALYSLFFLWRFHMPIICPTHILEQFLNSSHSFDNTNFLSPKLGYEPILASLTYPLTASLWLDHSM